VFAFLVAVAPITTTPGTSLTLVVSRVAPAGRPPGSCAPPPFAARMTG